MLFLSLRLNLCASVLIEKTFQAANVFKIRLIIKLIMSFISVFLTMSLHDANDITPKILAEMGLHGGKQFSIEEACLMPALSDYKP